MQYRTFPPLTLPGHYHLQKHLQSYVSSRGDATTTGRSQRTLPPHSPRRLLEEQLGQKTGCERDSWGTVVFAKRLINRPGIVPRSHTVFQPASLHLCFEQDSSCNYCLATLPLDPSLQTREVSLPRNHTSLHVPAGSALPHPGSRGDATHRDLMSLGLDPPQIAARGPLPKLQRHFCCGWEGRGGRQVESIHLSPALVPGLPCPGCSPL